METKTKFLPNGKKIEYLDVIKHGTISHFTFWERVKILLGCKVRVESNIYTMHEQCIVVGSDGIAFVEPLFRAKQVGMIQVADSRIDHQSAPMSVLPKLESSDQIL